MEDSMTALERLQKAWADRRHLCVGIDLSLGMLPKEGDPWGLGVTGQGLGALEALAKLIIIETAPEVAAFKPNLGFGLQYGPAGLTLLQRVVEMVRWHAPDALAVCDAKIGDIDNTNLTYLEFVREVVRAHAGTLNGYVGGLALEPFLSQADMMWFVLCRTSNKGADEFQNQMLANGRRLYEEVAYQFSEVWNGNHNVGLVVGATAIEELQSARRMAPALPILIPGVGAQGGDLEAAVRFGCFADGMGGNIINISRGVINSGRGCVARGGTFRAGVRAYVDDLNEQIRRALPVPAGG